MPIASAYSLDFSDSGSSFLIQPYTINGPLNPFVTTLYSDANRAAIAANTSLILFGKGVPDYGDFLQQNLLSLLQNFAHAGAPVYPVAGQLWFNTVDGSLNVYNGTAWTALISVGSTTLDDLADVVITVPQANQFLSHNGSTWTNTNLSQALIDLNGVDAGANNDFIIYSAGAWTNKSLAVTRSILDVYTTSQTDSTFAVQATAINTLNSLTGGGNLSTTRTLQLVNDVLSPGNVFYYGTNGSGTKGYYDLGNSFASSARNINTINSIVGGGNLTADRTLQLANDVASPGNSFYYGTNTGGTKGWFTLSTYALSALNLNVSGSITGGGNLTADRSFSLVNDVTSPGNSYYYGTNAVGTKGFFHFSSYLPLTPVDMNGQRVINVANPTANQDAATKAYVDSIAQGLSAKEPVVAATTANITLSGGAPNTLDGYALAAVNRILVKNQTAPSENGIYVVQTLGTGSNGTWVRTADMDAWTDVPSSYVFVQEGTTYADTGWICTSAPGGTFGTTAINWVQFSQAGTVTATNLTPVSSGSSTAGLFKQKNGTVIELYTINTPTGQGAVTVAVNNGNSTVDVSASAIIEAIHDLSSTGVIARTGAGTVATRSLTAPAAGITISNNDFVAGNPTFVLANDLAAVEGLSTTGLATRTATDTWTTRTITQPAAGITITNGDGVAGNPTLVLANDLAALEGLGSTGIAVRTATDTWAQRTIVSASGSTIVVTNGDGVAGNPTIDSNTTWKLPVHVKTTGSNITLAGGAPNTLDGISLAANDRILVTDQSTGSENGWYYVSTLGTGANGTWTRTLDADTSAEVVSGAATIVTAGTLYGNSDWSLSTANPITLGSTSLTFSERSGASLVSAGSGLVKGTGATRNQLDVDLAASISTSPSGASGGLAFDTAGVGGRLQIDPAVVGRKFTQLVGDGSSTSIAVTHNLDNQFPVTAVYEISTSAQVDVDVVGTSTSVTTFTFASAPATNAFRVMIIG